MHKHRTSSLALTAILISTVISGTCAFAQLKEVRNGNLNEIGAATLTQQAVDNLRKDGWTCPDAKDWPTWWGGLGGGMKVEYQANGGINNSRFLKIEGSGGLVAGYYEHAFEKPNYIITAWAQGKGTLGIGVIAYKMSADHKQILGQTSLPFLEVKVSSDKWVRYRHILSKGDIEVSVHPVFSAPQGSVAFDDVSIRPSNPALDLMIAEEAKLYSTGYLIENADLVQADDTFKTKAASYTEAVKAFREKSSTLDSELVKSLESEMSALEPYVLTKGLSSVGACYYNDMLVLTRVLNQLTGKPVGDTAATKWAEVKSDVLDHKPGVRPARKNAITITNVRSNKVHYVENEDARTTATVTNTVRAGAGTSGTLVALMHLDLDTTRELARTPFTILPGETKTWDFSYNVGSETYGRAVEVRLLDDNGKPVDSWEEFYAVAAEYFRVQQHTYHAANTNYEVSPWTTYLTQRHYFASEPTDFGVQTTTAERYKSGQGMNIFSPTGRKAEIAYYMSTGVDNSFYQTWAFCGQMGYEEVRKHPEYALYDPNGQLAVDPIYGGYPNPMEMASPIEIGPKRQSKPYLDKTFNTWQHCPANLAMEEVLIYETNCIKKYAEEYGLTGIYIDGNMGVAKGYGYDGTANVPFDSKPEVFAKLNARNHRIFSEILKKDNPNFGTWCNWSIDGVESCVAQGMTASIGSGSGAPGDAGDESIRAVTGWKNVLLLFETGNYYNRFSPSEFLHMLIKQRDWAVQKYEANTMIGYSDGQMKGEEPGPSKWAWATVNYIGAQIIATQMHYNDAFMPSHRPTLQFLTRYSRFIWSPDIKVLPNEEKVVKVSSPEEIWWKRLVYKRETDYGYDLIVHLVRIPPTKNFDVKWVDEPAPLDGIKVSVDLGSGVLQDAQAMRPYHFEEEQQPVHTTIEADVASGKASVSVPSFRYHTMIVFRVKTK